MSKVVRYVVSALVTTGATIGGIALYHRLRGSADGCGCGPSCACGPCKEKHGHSHDEKSETPQGGEDA